MEDMDDIPVLLPERRTARVVPQANTSYAESVPYEVSFTATLDPSDPSIYINPCCWAGDVISDRLIPVVEQRYQDVRSGQEDWGWFIWFRDGAIRLAVDIHCDEPTAGAFRVRLTSRRKKLIGSEMIDTPELDRLREWVTSSIAAWARSVRTERVED
jgi:hypothetical protein